MKMRCVNGESHLDCYHSSVLLESPTNSYPQDELQPALSTSDTWVWRKQGLPREDVVIAGLNTFASTLTACTSIDYSSY